MPARYRDRLGARFVLTIAQPDACLALYPESTWDAVCERLEDAPLKDARYRRFVRHLFANTEQTQCDSQGRLLIPPSLRTYAEIDRALHAIGAMTRVELWAPARLGELRPTDDEAAAFAADLGLF